jgi:hypothetical protein
VPGVCEINERERAYLKDCLILGRVKDRERRALNQVNFESVIVLVERTKSNESVTKIYS